MKNLFIGSLLLLTFITGCGSDACCQGDAAKGLVEEKIDLTGNITPKADFENLEIVSNGDECRFKADGSKSTDSDGSISSYQWVVNNTDVSTAINPVNTLFPCSATIKKPIIVCLTVIDDKGAQSIQKCKTVELTVPNLIPVLVPTPTLAPELIPPTAIMNFTKVSGEDAYIFNCNDSYDNDDVDSDNNPTEDPNVVKCFWSVFKTSTIDGSDVAIHEKDGFLKWMSTSPDKYSALHITLTVTDDDNQTNTITNSYELNTTR